jgi:hypothetical protein
VSDAASVRQTGSLLDVITKCHKIHDGFYTYNLDQPYSGNRTLLDISCPVHGPFTQMAMSHLAGRGCRVCGYEKVALATANYAVSKGETELMDFFSDKVKVLQSERSVLNGLELDIYFPDHKVAVEFNGLYWHSDQHKDRNYHLDKTLRCREKVIDLIHIWEDEWRDKREIVLSIIGSRLGLSKERVYARKTEVVYVSSAEARLFYDTNHMQGFVGASTHIGLAYRGRLVSLASFSAPRTLLNTKSLHDLELIRFCSLLDTTVVGALGRLMATQTGKSVLTYCDTRLFNASGYLAAGFRLSHQAAPGYCYVKGSERFSRFRFQKHKLSEVLESYDPSLTEQQNMAANGFSRLYDCGNACLVKSRA